MNNDNHVGQREVFCPFIRKSGKKVYPKNAKYFHFWVDETESVAQPNSAEQLSMLSSEEAK